MLCLLWLPVRHKAAARPVFCTDFSFLKMDTLTANVNTLTVNVNTLTTTLSLPTSGR